MVRKSRTLATVALMLALVWIAGIPAHAEIVLSQSRTSAAIYGGATYIVDFNGSTAGGTSFTFATPAANTRVMIIFNAECAVDGATTRWVEVDVLVDPAGAIAEFTVTPTSSDNAFCSGNGTTTTAGGNFDLDGWVSASLVASVVLPVAGTHTIRIRVKGANSTLARLDDMSLVVAR